MTNQQIGEDRSVPLSCPTCGSPVRVVSSDEGTSYYEPAVTRASTGAGLDVELLAEAIGIIAIEDRDRTIAGDYRADTYVEHANRLAAEYARLAAARLPAAEGSDPYRDYNEHERQSLAGAHNFDPHCAFCFHGHFDADTRAALTIESPAAPPEPAPDE